MEVLYETMVNVMQSSFLIVIVANTNYLDHVLYIFLFENQGHYLNTYCFRIPLLAYKSSNLRCLTRKWMKITICVLCRETEQQENQADRGGNI